MDDARLLSPEMRQRLAKTLVDFATQTKNQVVVVTMKDLQGLSIEEYGYQLGRHWGIGQKEKDNGILLLVAPKERKVRIEVGYGLEGVFTDALTHAIIQQRILPAFKEGAMEKGIVQGTIAILQVFQGEEQEPQEQREGGSFSFVFLLLIGAVLLIFLSMGGGPRSRGGWGGPFYSGRGGGSFGGGFSGGGGSFGGGGSSGSW